MITTLLHRTVLILLAAAACGLLADRFGTGLAFVIWAGVMAAACLTGAALLRTAPLGRISWKNRVAVQLLPWGYRLSRGRLGFIVLVSWLVWVAIGAAILLVASPGRAIAAGETGSSSPWMTLALFATWVVDGFAFLYVLGIWITNSAPGSSATRSLGMVLAFLAAIMCVSVVLDLSGWPLAALVIAGGPPLLLGIFYGAFLGIILIFGRNIRWN